MEIADWLLRLTTTHRGWGFGLCYLYLRSVKNYIWNYKHIYRIYRELELNLRIKPRSRIKRDKPEGMQVPDTINKVWSVDFMSDSLTDSRSIRIFNAIDGYNREGLCIDVDFSLPAAQVIRSLTHVIEWRGKPMCIRCEFGPEYIAQSLKDWARENEIVIQ